MEKVKNTKDKYINKTYLWKETEKPPAAHLKKWIAEISKDMDDINPPMSINWVKWIHNFTGVSHCFSCLMLHGCWFNDLNMPEQPLHERCHCSTEPIPYSQVLAEIKAKSDYSKFDPYLFNRGGNILIIKRNYLKNGDTVLMMQNGCRQKSNDKAEKIILQEDMRWVS